MRLAVDIGATKTSFGRFDESGQQLYLDQVSTAIDRWQHFVAMFESGLLRAEATGRSVTDFGVSVAGTVNPTDGVVACANVPSISGRSLAADLRQLTDRPVYVKNDAQCLALAEAFSGAGTDYGRVFVIVLGSGIGGAVVTDRELIVGADGQAGEWGHGNEIDGLVKEHGLTTRDCGCGRRNCLDLFGAGLGMSNIHSDLAKETKTAREILFSWHQGDAAAAETVDVYVDIVSATLAKVIGVRKPDIVPVAGGLSNDAVLIGTLDQATRRKSLHQLDRPLLVPATNNVHGCLRGAALLGPA